MKRRAGQRRARPLRPICWTDRALADLEGIGDYIARDDPAAAARWVTRLVAAAENVGRAPLAGRRVPELSRHDVRESFLRSYRIVYRLREERVEILTVFEGHHLFPTDLALPAGEDEREVISEGEAASRRRRS
jgi:plasmid stabilization system protein ParE